MPQAQNDSFKLEQFGGMLPAWDEQLLPQGQSAFSQNGYLFSGALLGWRKPKLLRTLTNSAAKMVYRLPQIFPKKPNAVQGAITDFSEWLEFTDPDTDVMRSPVIDDTFDRYYFASPSTTPQYNTRARIADGSPAWLLGVPTPGCTPGVAVVGGGSDATLGFPNVSVGTVEVGTPGANIIYLIPITPKGAMLLNEVTAVPQVTNATASLAAVLYSDLNGSPHTLMNTGVQITGFAATATVTSAFINPTGLLMDVQYWIGFMCDTAVPFQEANTVSNAGVVCINTYSNGPPVVINNLSTGYPALQVWGGLTTSALQEARSYVYTYVSEYDEESAPSPATVAYGWANGTWTIDLFQPPSDQLGTTRNLTLTRIYRSITALSGATTYFFVAELPITQATYIDTITDDLLAMERQLISQLWTPPPENMQGILAMPNGMAVGFAGNEIWFCEPFRPHAWPASYTLTTEYPIIGLGVTNTSVVICTSGVPYVATGVAPGSMTMNKTQTPEPCLSRRSVLGNTDGVYYASPNGLILVDQNGFTKNTTELWITRERWQQLVPQKFLRAVFLVSSYFAMGTTVNGDTSVAQRGFTIELNSADSQSFTIWPQPGGHRLGFNLLSAPNGFDVDNVLLDPWTGVCLLVQNGAVYYYDFADPAPAMVPFKWRSKQFQQKTKKNFEVVRVIFSVPPNTPTQGTRNTAATADGSWTVLGANQYGILRVYGDGHLVTTREIYTSNEVLRILSGFKYEVWQFEIEARVVVSTLQVGTSLKALAKV